jgi:hypothetical protein
MLIFERESKYYIFIHIPKNSGKYIRNEYKNDKNNKIIKSFWNVKSNFDLAHIPYMLNQNYVKKNIEYNYFTFTRNPYDRLISAFFYKNPKKNNDDLKKFILNTLVKYKFSTDFKSNIIHYYPQYLFVCDNNFNIPQNIKISKLENIKKYNLTDYYDNDCIQIINNIYNNDFLLFDYQIISSI